MKNSKEKHNRLKLWLLFVVSVVLPPLLLFAAGVYYAGQQTLELRRKNIERQAADYLDRLSTMTDTEQVLCQTINTRFEESKTAAELEALTNKLRKNFNLSFDTLIWNQEGQVYSSTFSYKNWRGNWQKAYHNLRYIDNRIYTSEAQIPIEVYANLRALFGPHFFPRYTKNCHTGKDLSLLNNDSSGKKPLLWIKVHERYGLAAFFAHEVLNTYPFAETMVRRHADEVIQLAIVNKEKVFCSRQNEKPILESLLKKFNSSYSSSFMHNDYLIVPRYIDQNLSAFCLVESNKLKKNLLPKWLFATSLLCFFLIMAVLYYSYQSLVNNKIVWLSLQKQLILLFLISNALPGFILTIASWDYLQEYRQSLLNKAYNSSLSYLHSIDELFKNEFGWQKKQLKKGLKFLKPELQNGKIEAKSVQAFLKRQSPEPYRMFLVASSSGYVASHEAVMRKGKVIKIFDKDFNRGPHKKKQLIALDKIGRYFLALLNNTKIPAKMGTEVEILTEALYLQPPLRVMQDFIGRHNSFWNWGMGMHRHPVYLNIIQLFSPEIYDYMLLYFYDSDKLQLNFMLRSFDNFSRNQLGIKVMAVDDKFLTAMPKSLVNNKRIKEFANRLRDKTARRLNFCTWNSKEHLLVGLKCNQLTHFRLLGLYPLEKIDRGVANKRNLLLKLGLLSIIITLALGLSLAGSFLTPLKDLEKGVNALKERNFTYRLPDLGKDEFGEVAKLFNSTLIDLEELQVAAKVKNKLTTAPDEPLELAHLRILCKKIATKDMGGDFINVETLTESNAAVLLADVAGSGVAATLVQAFISSALMRLETLATKPEKMLAELGMMLAAGSQKKHRKFMACAYFMLSGESELIRICNAGLVLPLIFNKKTKDVKHLELKSLPLGSNLAKPEKVTELKLQQDELFIVFTNGINANGKISNQEIFALLKEADSRSLEALYESFAQIYRQTFLTGNNHDDISMVIVGRL
jgi:hypothetical protein